MAYIYNCCFYFSLRLGSIIIGIFSLVQGLSSIIISSIGVNNPSRVASDVANLRHHFDLIFMNSFLGTIQNDIEKYLTILLIASAIYTTSCIVMIYGAYTCSEILIYPYIVLENLRFVALFCGHVILMMIIKENVVNLGLLIGLTVFGGFLLLGLFYLWFCVLNLVLVVKKLRKEINALDSKLVSRNTNVLIYNNMQNNKTLY